MNYYKGIINLIFDSDIQFEIFNEIEEQTQCEIDSNIIFLLNDYYIKTYLNEDLIWNDLTRDETTDLINLRISQLIDMGKILVNLYKEELGKEDLEEQQSRQMNENIDREKERYYSNNNEEEFEEEEGLEEEEINNQRQQFAQRNNMRQRDVVDRRSTDLSATSKENIPTDNEYIIDESLLSEVDRENYEKIKQMRNSPPIVPMDIKADLR